MNREQLAWAAGIMDGEGYIANQRNSIDLKDGTPRVYYVPQIKVAQTAKYGGMPDMVSRLMNMFVGSKLLGPYKRGRSYYREIYEWRIHGFEKVQIVLASLWPWLGLQKRKDAIQMMNEYLNNRPPMEWRRGPAPGSRTEWPRNDKGQFIKHG